MATLTQIAKVSGVSCATVSTVLNNTLGDKVPTNVRVSESTRQRVLEAAQSLGYRRNDLARAMVTGKTKVVGLLAPTFESEMHMQILVGAQEIATKHGYLLKLLQVPPDPEKMREVIAQCAQQRLAGVLAVSLLPAAMEFLEQEAANYQISVVLVDEAPPQDWASHVSSQDESGMRAAIDHFAQWGHRQIAFLGGPRDSILTQRREEIFRAVLAEKSLTLPDHFVVNGDWWEPKVNEPLIIQLLQTPQRPTAILCASDWAAMTALRTARFMGYVVPDDLSVIGFGDMTFCHFADPPLTSIHQPFQIMGQRALECLMADIAPDSALGELRQIELLTDLTLRASTGPCPA